MTHCLATLETAHFRFVAIGLSRDHAERAMRATWDEHRRQHPHRPPAPFTELAEDVTYLTVADGDGYRDNVPLVEGIQP